VLPDVRHPAPSLPAVSGEAAGDHWYWERGMYAGAPPQADVTA
jgi:hypothetical protein